MKSLFYVGLLLTIYCNSATYAYPSECNKGPEYWCANLSNADDCDAIGHCQQTVWELQSLDSIPKCEECKTFIDSVRADKLDNGRMLRSVYHFCKHFESKIKCKVLVTVKAKAVLRIINSNLPSEKVCHYAHLCNNKLENIKPETRKNELVGAQQCTWGPSYWCANLSNSRDCHATSHCVQRVWSNMEVAKDTDSVCEICTDMVKQARDQLESNQTQNDLKAVFEGSCKLIPIKMVSSECIKMVDEFIPELVETLASQMNPQVVCSVAGLCNNARIDALIADYNNKLKRNTEGSKQCSGCLKVLNVAKRKFDEATYEEILISLLKGCRTLGSYTDACSAEVFSRFDDLHQTLRQQFKSYNSQQVCRASGMCSSLYHQHPEDDAYVPLDMTNDKDDVPCEFCEQLVVHLRDILVANTTAQEFYRVLKGLCSQSGNFKKECLSLVEQWYPVVYNYLVSDLKPKEICSLAGICQDGKYDNVPIAPLIPAALIVTAAQSKLNRVQLPQRQVNVRVMEPDSKADASLPIERMFVSLPQNKPVCQFCQYFLHYLQVEISDFKNEEKVKEAVEHACDRLPSEITDQCKEFVEAYGPSIIALLVQEIDPASVCPALGICPKTIPIRKVEINSQKSTCPLCLFAVEQLKTLVKDNVTEANIEKALHNLCNHLSKKMQTECVDFVDAYSSKLIEMILADLNAEEICVHLKLCPESSADVLGLQTSPIDKFFDKPQLQQDRNKLKKHIPASDDSLNKKQLDHMIETNEIPDNTINGHVQHKLDTVQSNKGACVICEFVMKEIDDEIKDKHNDDEIKTLVHNVCKRMPKSVHKECDQFVDKYADLIIAVLGQEMNPTLVCQQLKLCDPTFESPAPEFQLVRETILECAVCEAVVKAVEKVLSNEKVDDDVVKIAEKACHIIPAKYYKRCHNLMDVYGNSIIQILRTVGAEKVCEKIGECVAMDAYKVNLYKGLSNENKKI